jgi:hypothetical protein
MITIAGGIVLGFFAIWLILYLIAHSDEIVEAIFIELPKALLRIVPVVAGLILACWAIGWTFRRLPDMGKAIASLGGFLLFVLAMIYCAIRDFRKWRREKRTDAPS